MEPEVPDVSKTLEDQAASQPPTVTDHCILRAGLGQQKSWTPPIFLEIRKRTAGFGAGALKGGHKKGWLYVQ